MGSLNDALPRENATASAEHAVKSDRGLYKAFFLGITAPYQWVPAALDAWYSSLPTPIKVPCFVVIQDNRSGTALKITDVLPRAKGAATPAAGAAPAERVPFTEDEPSPAERARAAVDELFPDDSELPF